MEKTINVQPCEVAEVLPWLATLTNPKADTSGGLASVADICARAQAYSVKIDGQIIGAYAIEGLQYDRGCEIFLVGGVGAVDGLDLTELLIPAIEAQARGLGARQLALMTRRRGLLRKLAAQGYTVAGIKLVKKL